MAPWMFRRPISSAKGNGEGNLTGLSKSFMYKGRNRQPRSGPCGAQKLTFGLDIIDKISINWNVLHPVCALEFKPVLSYSSYSIMPQLY